MRIWQAELAKAEMQINHLSSSIPTDEMRAPLTAKGLTVPMPDGEVWDLSLKFNEHLDAMPDGRQRGWIALFKEMDNDDSGVLTYDEIHALARKKLKLSAKDLPDDTIKALWCWSGPLLKERERAKTRRAVRRL